MTLISSGPITLRSGDRLTRDEFHRRYEAAPPTLRAELVEGVVYVTSPVSRRHSRPHAWMVTWVGAYQVSHPDLQIDDNVTTFLDSDSEVQPDLCLWYEEPGGPRETGKGYIEGAPQFVVEVAFSSASYDLHDKLRAYERNGVREYVVWRVEDQAIDWFRLRDSIYERVEPDERGVIESTTFRGLRLNVPKMLAGDLAGVLAELEPAR